MTNEIKFMYNGIKINGKLIKGSWSYGDFINKNIKATFYMNGYDFNSSKILRECFKVENESDIMTDYFEEDKIRFFVNDKNLEEVKKAWQKQEIKLINRAKSWSEEEKAQRIKKVMAA